MKQIAFIFLLALAICAGSYAQPCSRPVSAHCESVGNNDDGDEVAFNALTITSIFGTAHKGGANQGDADSRGITYSIYIGWDSTRASGIDAGDEPPNAASTLSSGVNNAVTTLPVTATTFFYNEGLVLIDSELIAYTGKTATTLTGCTRGYNETNAASHSGAAAVTMKAGFKLVTTIVCDGAPYNAIGWDESSAGADDGTEGELLQDGTTITLTKHRSYLIKIRATDGSGNSNTEVSEVDTFYSFSSDCYVDEDGDAAQALEDDEVWAFTTQRRPTVAFLKRFMSWFGG